MLREGSIGPIQAIERFEVGQIYDAFLHFTKPSRIGKIVLTYDNPKALLKVLSLRAEIEFHG